jgi:hypothetical protein
MGWPTDRKNLEQVLYLKGLLTGQATSSQAQGSRESRVIDLIPEDSFFDVIYSSPIELSAILQYRSTQSSYCYVGKDFPCLRRS